jgi:hypothetical protein
MCKKSLRALARECPGCRTDLSLLIDYSGALRDGLAQAEAQTRGGDLAGAVWTYLEVLEVDPDCPAAKRQVGRVAAAVRQFDKSSPGRRWFHRVRAESGSQSEWSWAVSAVWFILVVAALLAGYMLGQRSVAPDHAASSPSETQE